MTQPERHYSPAEVSRLLGVSAKALRLYEARGLVTARKASNGWRAYGRSEIARLTKVLALKGLRLSLSQIAELLEGMSLDQALAAHEEVLEREAALAAHALGLVRAAREKLRSGEALSIDDLATLAKETTMTRTSPAKEMGKLMKPFVARHFSDGELEKIKQSAPPYDQEQVARDWDEIFAEVRTLMEAGDSTSPRAIAVARRWQAGTAAFSIDPETRAKAQVVWQDAMADTETGPKLPIDPGVFAFVRRIREQADET